MFSLSADESDNGIGLCGWLLTAISWALVFVTLPFSLCVCFKVTLMTLTISRILIPDVLLIKTSIVLTVAVLDMVAWVVKKYKRTI